MLMVEISELKSNPTKVILVIACRKLDEKNKILHVSTNVGTYEKTINPIKINPGLFSKPYCS